MTGRARKPVTPRQPAGPRQPEPPGRDDGQQTSNLDVYKPKDYVVVLWIGPELRERYPDMPLSLYEAAELGRKAERDREAGS
jgi:hypothetical protein